MWHKNADHWSLAGLAVLLAPACSAGRFANTKASLANRSRQGQFLCHSRKELTTGFYSRDLLLRPLQVLAHLARVVHALSKSRPRPREPRLRLLLQVQQLAVLVVEAAGSAILLASVLVFTCLLRNLRLRLSRRIRISGVLARS